MSTLSFDPVLTQHERFIYFFAHRFARPGVSLPDLVQEARIALYLCWRDFPGLPHFHRRVIRRAIIRYLSLDGGSVSEPPEMITFRPYARARYQELLQSRSAEVTPKDVWESLRRNPPRLRGHLSDRDAFLKMGRYTLDMVVRALEMDSLAVQSLDDPATEHHLLLEPFEEHFHENLMLEEVLFSLPDHYREVLVFWAHGYTPTEVASATRRSAQQVSDLITIAVKKARIQATSLGYEVGPKVRLPRNAQNSSQSSRVGSNQHRKRSSSGLVS